MIYTVLEIVFLLSRMIFYLDFFNFSMLVLVLLAGKGVGALDAKYGDWEGIVVENAEK